MVCYQFEHPLMHIKCLQKHVFGLRIKTNSQNHSLFKNFNWIEETKGIIITMMLSSYSSDNTEMMKPKQMCDETFWVFFFKIETFYRLFCLYTSLHSNIETASKERWRPSCNGLKPRCLYPIDL